VRCKEGISSQVDTDGVADSALGRRFVARLDETMAESMSMRGGAVLLAAIVLLPLSMRAQAQKMPRKPMTNRPGR